MSCNDSQKKGYSVGWRSFEFDTISDPFDWPGIGKTVEIDLADVSEVIEIKEDPPLFQVFRGTVDEIAQKITEIPAGYIVIRESDLKQNDKFLLAE